MNFFNLKLWFKGRIDRKTFFSVLLVNMFFGTAFLVGAVALSNQISPATESLIIKALIVAVILLIYFVVLVFSLSLYVRRLHDVGRSGLWSLLLFVPLANILIFIYLLLKNGDKEENKYGQTFSFKNNRWLVFLVIGIFILGLFGFAANFQKQRADRLVKEGDEALLMYNPHTAFLKYKQAQAVWPFLNSDEHIRQKKKAVTDMFQNPGVIIFLKDGASTKDIQSLMEEIKILKGVERIQFTSKEKALQIYKNTTKPSDELLSLLRPDILPTSLDVYITDDSVKAEIVQIAKSKIFVEAASKYTIR